MDVDRTAPAEPGDAASGPAEADAAWAEVEARWQEEGAHRAFLASHADLDGLAEAGRRYRQVLEARPGDPVALRWRDEVLKKATVLAMAQLPRTRPPQVTGWNRIFLNALLATAFLALLAAAAWAAMNFPALSRAVRGGTGTPL